MVVGKGCSADEERCIISMLHCMVWKWFIIKGGKISNEVETKPKGLYFVLSFQFSECFINGKVNNLCTRCNTCSEFVILSIIRVVTWDNAKLLVVANIRFLLLLQIWTSLLICCCLLSSPVGECHAYVFISSPFYDFWPVSCCDSIPQNYGKRHWFW